LVAHILCTATGAPAPIWTRPTRTARVGWRLGVSIM
jgi:hypothetical protein